MGAYGGQGPMVNAVLWVEVVVGVIFVGLRLYTRKVLLNNVGWDDYLALAALVRIDERQLQFNTASAMTDKCTLRSFISSTRYSFI